MTKEFENLNLLLFYRWKRSYKFYGIVFALYLAFCLFALLMKGEQLGWVRYEVYFGSRPCLLLFLAALSVVIVYQVATLLYMQLRSNALHRYLILPQSRVPFMLSELLMNISAIVILLLLQYAVYYIGYRYYMTLAPLYNLKNGFLFIHCQKRHAEILVPIDNHPASDHRKQYCDGIRYDSVSGGILPEAAKLYPVHCQYCRCFVCMGHAERDTV